MLVAIFGARIAGWLAGIGGYIVAAGAVVLAIFGLYAKVRGDGKAAGVSQEREAARKNTDKAIEARHEVDNDINAGSGDDARKRLRDNWKR